MVKNISLASLLVAGALLAVSITACVNGAEQPPAAEIAQPVINLNVAAATSLTDALNEINALYAAVKPNIKVIANFASSGILQQQIEYGGPVDVFISAATIQMDNLQQKQLILTDTRRNLLGNEVALIVPQDSALAITGFRDLASAKISRVAAGDPKSVPAGIYAYQVFDLLGITAVIQNKVVLASNVRQVLTYVETGNVDAGVVYFTDAQTSEKVKIVATAPADINARVEYPAAVIKSTKYPDAAKGYMDFLFGSQARAVFEKYGFSGVVND